MKNIFYFVCCLLCIAHAVRVNAQTPTAMETALGVEINWRTESETDCQIWEIERSFFADSNYQMMAQIPGQGTTNEPHDYSWIDSTVVAVNTYYYRLAEVNSVGDRTYYGPVSVVVSFYGVAGAPVTSDRAFSLQLKQNYPNPFDKTTVISYQAAVDGPVKLAVYNIAGQLVRDLTPPPLQRHLEREAREGSVTWDGKDENGWAIPNGIYIYCLESGDFKVARKMIILK